MKKAPNEVDRNVGSRIRMRRMMVDMSQEKLGGAIGLTFQQVQKYEKGTNRVSASRLQQIAGVLGVGIEFFYEGLSAGGETGFSEGRTGYDSGVMTTDGLKLLKAFHNISDPKVRRRLLDLAAALASTEEAAPDGADRSE